MKIRFCATCFTSLLAGALLTTALATAADCTWTGTGSLPNWSLLENWSDETPPTVGDRLIFNGTTGLYPNNDFTPGLTFAGFLFNNAAGAFTLSGNAIALGGAVTNLSSAEQNITVDMTLAGPCDFYAMAGGISLAGALSGAGGIVKSGAGSVRLSGANSYHGTTGISDGTLVVAAAELNTLDNVGKPLLWFDALDTATLTINNSGRVTGWRNKGSKLSMDAVVPSGFNGPLLVNSPYAGGRQMLRLDGNSQGLVTAGNTGISGNSGRTMFFVGYRAVGTTLIVTIGTPEVNRSFGVSDQSDKFYWYAYGTGMDITKAASPGNEVHVYSFISHEEPSEREGFVDGASGGLLTGSLNTTDTPLYIGYRSNNIATRGDIGEVIVYDRSLSPTEQVLVENYLLAKWTSITADKQVSALPFENRVEIAAGASLALESGVSFISDFAAPSNSAISIAEEAELTVIATNGVSIGSTITGSGTLTKRGSHTLTLNGTSLYSGTTAVHGGALIIDHLSNGGVGSAIGASSSSPSNLVLGASTLRLTSSGNHTSDRGLLIASEKSNRASTLHVAGDVTLSGRIECSCGSFIKDGPGTLRLTGAEENLFSANASYYPTTELDTGIHGDAPSVGFGGVSVAGGKLVLGAEGQTNRFAGEFLVGIRTAEPTTAALEINGGMTTGTTWIAVGRGDSTNGLTSSITINNGSLIMQALSMGYSAFRPNFWSCPVLNVNGGLFHTRSYFYAGESDGAAATININGGILRSEADIRCGVSSNASCTVNLSGGVVETRNISRGSGTCNLIFDGGILRPLIAGQLLQNLTSVMIGAGGAVFDTSLADYTINQPLLHLEGLAGTDGGVEKTGSGTLIFSDTNPTYNGPTLVSGGTLRQTGTLPATTTVTVADGGCFVYAGTAGTMGAVSLQAGGVFGPTPETLLLLNGTTLTAAPGSIILLTNGVTQTVAFSDALSLGEAAATPVTLMLDVAADGAGCDQLTTAGALALGAVNISLRRAGTTFPYAHNSTIRILACDTDSNPDISGLTVVNGAGGKTYTLGTVVDQGRRWITVTITNDLANATIWNSTSSGLWSVSSNWSLPPTGLVSSLVRFDDAIVSDSQVTLDQTSQAVGAMYFNSLYRYTLAGNGALTLDNTMEPAHVVVEAGSHTISTPLELVGGVDVAPAAGAQLTLTENITGNGPLQLTDAGAVVLEGTNQTGVTTLSAGTLKISDAAALGGDTAVMTFNSGTLETSASIALGSTGQAALDVAAHGGTINQATGATLTLGSAVTGPGRLTVENGTLVTDGTLKPGALELNNLLLRNEGTTTAVITPPLAWGGTVAVETAPGDITLAGTISQSTGRGATTLAKRGPGALTIASSGNWSSASQRTLLTVEEGLLCFAAGVTNTIDLSSGTAQSLYVGSAAGKQATLRVESQSALTLLNDLRVCAAANALGRVDISGGTVVAGWLSVAPGNNMNGILTISNGGTLQHQRYNSEIGIAGYNASDSEAYGYMSITSGGTLNLAGYTQNLQIGRYGSARIDVDGGTLRCRDWSCLGRFATGFGELNIRNGVVEHSINNAFGVAELGKGTLNVHSGGVMRAINTVGSNYGLYLSLNNAATQRTAINIWHGGVVEPTRLVASSAGSIVYNSLNFHGGTLRAYTSNMNDFLRLRINANDTSRAYVWPEGAVIDTNGKEVVVPEPLVAPHGYGVSAITLLDGGVYHAPPLVWLEGGGGVGATASAMLDASGVITNVFITNPGVGYSSAPTVQLYGGSMCSPATIATVMLAPCKSGGLTKQGAGVLTMTGLESTYTGMTVVAAGTLKAGPGVLTGTEELSIRSGAYFDMLGGAHTMRGLSGAGTISNGSITVTGLLAAGDSSGATGTLNVRGNLTLASDATLVHDIVGAAHDLVNVTGDLTLNHKGWIDFGREDGDPIDTSVPLKVMTFSGVCDNQSQQCIWHVKNAGKSGSTLVATLDVRDESVYVIIRYSGTLLMLR